MSEDAAREAAVEQKRSLLRKNDALSLDQRAQRLLQLETITTDGRKFSSQLEWDYTNEAGDCYVNGAFRSTIFCCVCAAERMVTFEYLSVQPDMKAAKGELKFGVVLDRCKSLPVPKIVPFLTDLDLMRRIRNGVAVHPGFRDLPARTEEQRHLRTKPLHRDVFKMADLLRRASPDYAEQWAASEFTREDKSIRLRGMLDGDSVDSSGAETIFELSINDALQFLALKCWHVLRNLSQSLYSPD